jgi:hypothetical protein
MPRVTPDELKKFRVETGYRARDIARETGLELRKLRAFERGANELSSYELGVLFRFCRDVLLDKAQQDAEDDQQAGKGFLN